MCCFDCQFTHAHTRTHAHTHALSVGALVILAMLGEREPVVIRSRLDLLLERAFAGFGDDGADEVNFDFAKQACIAIKHLAKV